MDDDVSIEGNSKKSNDSKNRSMEISDTHGLSDRGIFQVDTALIPQAEINDPTSELTGSLCAVYNTYDFEQGVQKQVDLAILQKVRDQQCNRLSKQLLSVREDINLVEDCLSTVQRVELGWPMRQSFVSSTAGVIGRQTMEPLRLTAKRKRLTSLRIREKFIMDKLSCLKQNLLTSYANEGIEQYSHSADQESISSVVEFDPELMVRTGDMTPFGTTVEPFLETSNDRFFPSCTPGKHTEDGQSLQPEASFHCISTRRTDNLCKEIRGARGSNFLCQDDHVFSASSQENLSALGTVTMERSDFTLHCAVPQSSTAKTDEADDRCLKKRALRNIQIENDASLCVAENSDRPIGAMVLSDEDYIPSENESSPDTDIETDKPVRKKLPKKTPQAKRNVRYRHEDSGGGKALARYRSKSSAPWIRDDADEDLYIKRLRCHQQLQGLEPGEGEDDKEFDGGFVVPGKLWSRLYRFQRTCVRWLWELHQQETGGIVGDEMGLGKTIEVIAFLAALSNSKLHNDNFQRPGLGPVLVVCPATVMFQWVRELHTWWPDFRVAVLHSSSSFTGHPRHLVRDMFKSNGVLVTSYATMVAQLDILLLYRWHYLVLDEGHKIRNPDAKVTICCKQFRTPHRLILSGSPVQNNLKELWSLLDFVFPGKLGTLPDFMAHFSIPIVQGGYSNATDVQVETAFRCACVLRNTVSPYLLRRMKADVRQCLNLPGKNEQVLFCRLTNCQRDVYKNYLDSDQCQDILAGKVHIFPGLIMLRKICNHPDLCTGNTHAHAAEDDSSGCDVKFGYWRRSGKMVVVEALLKLWIEQGHRVLLFSQSRQMLDIIERFIQDCKYSYLRMDGRTSVSLRQPLVAKFNETSSISIFLLTTRVGGLGINLTGADRVVVYDPDWNPSTDSQARERAWRIGQTRHVTVYRLLTSGTIEEKIYHRQIFKQFLTNRVLKDPKQSRFFKSSDLHELFTLGSGLESRTETSALFAGTKSDVDISKCSAALPRPTVKPSISSSCRRLNTSESRDKDDVDGKVDDADERNYSLERSLLGSSQLDEMRRLAKKLSHRIEKNKQQRQTSSEACCGRIPDKHNREGTSSVLEGAQVTLKQEDKSDTVMSGKEKRSRRRKYAKLDGHEIPHLVRSGDVSGQSSDVSYDSRESCRDDDYVLRRLFKRAGVHGALKHDRIMDASGPDYVLVEAEATKVAMEAVAALRKSRVLCNSAVSGIPSWTGSSGKMVSRQRFGQKNNSLLSSTVKPSPSYVRKHNVHDPKATGRQNSGRSPFDGSQAGVITVGCHQQLSSADILQHMTSCNRLSPAETAPYNGRSGHQGVVAPSDGDLLTDIQSFIAFKGQCCGQSSTQELLDRFQSRLPSVDSAKFKAMLLQICDFSKSSGEGVWTLKPEFR